MKNSTTAFDKFLSPYKTKENLAKENRNTKTYELSFVTELCNTYSNDEDSEGTNQILEYRSTHHCEDCQQEFINFLRADSKPKQSSHTTTQSCHVEPLHIVI